MAVKSPGHQVRRHVERCDNYHGHESDVTNVWGFSAGQWEAFTDHWTQIRQEEE